MLQGFKKSTVVASLLVLGTGAAVAQETIGAPSDTWKVPTCQRIVGTSGVTYTLDEGATLTPTTRPLTGTSYSAGLAALGAPNTLLAAVNSTLLRSTDAGCSWKTLADLSEASGYELLSLEAAGRDRAYVWSDNRSVLFRVDGTTVTSLRSPVTIVGIAADPANGDRVRIGDDHGQIWESVDAGATWQPVGVPALADPNGSAYRVAFDPNDLDHVLVGEMSYGASVTHDGGQTWTPSSGLAFKANVNVFNAVISPADPQVVWAMGIDLSDSSRHIYRSVDGGTSFTRVIENANGVTLINGPYMAAHPTDPNVLYFVFGMSFGGYGTDLYRFDAATGQVTLHHNAYHGIKAIEFSPASPAVMYLGVVHEQVN